MEDRDGKANQRDSKRDFISRYVKLLSNITDAPEEFQEAAALFLVSAMAGRRWTYRSIPETSIFGDRSEDFGKPLNLWFVLLGKSRIARKSTGVVRHVEDLVKDILGERFLLSKSFTPEFLVKEMAEKTSADETHCIWISDEIAGFFQQLRKRGSYMTSADALLSTIYDGNTYSRGTIRREKEVVPNPYLVCLLASTDYLPTLFDELHIRLGFLNRFINVLGVRKERKPLRTSPLDEDERREAEYIRRYLNALAERGSLTVIVMDEHAKKLYDLFEERIEERIEKEDLDIREGYYGNLPNLVIRLSCLYRLSRMTPDEIRSYQEPTLAVQKQDVERAIDYSWKAWSWFENVIEIMQTSSSKTAKLGLAKEFMIDSLKERGLMRGRSMCMITAKQIGCSIATAYNARKDLKEERRICQPKFGYVKIKEACKTCRWRQTCRMPE